MPARFQNQIPARRVKFDLNSDLGEGEPPECTRALMSCITSANIACGGHAGGLRTMEACIRLAKKFRVRLGAHPGPWSRADYGRGLVEISPDEFDLLLLQQVAALERIARGQNVRLHHIKLHGGLYHASENSDAIARRYVSSVARWWPRVRIYALAGGRVAHTARRAGVPVWEEIFADRAYEPSGALVSRGRPGALIPDARTAAARIRHFLATETIAPITGTPLRLRAQTICVHADTPGAPAMARAVARAIRS